MSTHKIPCRERGPQLQNDLEKHRKMHNHERDLVGLENQVIRSDVQKVCGTPPPPVR